ncbi:MAG: hypothetical protein IKB66_03070, partial [Clostridia bacterium]|nr:hypothetical protein [Clostridia bacterium]
MRIVFMGTPDFAVPALDKIYNSKHEILACITQPDKPSDRGHKITPSPVKVYAKEKHLTVLQYNKIREQGVEDLKMLAPDIVVTAAFGQILSQEILDIPKHGVINIHASLLPKYRGSAPIARRLHPDAEGRYSWWSYRFNARKNNAGWRIDYFIVS